MIDDEQNELRKDAESFAYQYIKHSGLFQSLSGEQWDTLAKLIAARLMGITDDMVDIVATVVNTSSNNAFEDAVTQVLGRYRAA